MFDFIVIDIWYRKRLFCSSNRTIWRIFVTIFETVNTYKSRALAVISQAEMRNWPLGMIWAHPSDVYGMLVHVGY